MKTNMNIDERILNGFTVETINPETGEVQWWDLKNGEKFTRKDLIGTLEAICGWSLGERLLFRVKGNLVEIMDENHSLLATTGKKLAETFRNVPYAKFIY